MMVASPDNKDANTLTVHVKLFATLRRYCPDLGLGEALPVQIVPGTTAGQVARQLKLPGVKLIFVNGVAQKEGLVLSDNDEIAFVPPIGGG